MQQARQSQPSHSCLIVSHDMSCCTCIEGTCESSRRDSTRSLAALPRLPAVPGPLPRAPTEPSTGGAAGASGTAVAGAASTRSLADGADAAAPAAQPGSPRGHKYGVIMGAGPFRMRKLGGAGTLREGHGRVWRQVARKVCWCPVYLPHGAPGARRSPPEDMHACCDEPALCMRQYGHKAT